MTCSCYRMMTCARKGSIGTFYRMVNPPPSCGGVQSHAEPYAVDYYGGE